MSLTRKDLISQLAISSSEFYRLAKFPNAPSGNDLKEWQSFLATARKSATSSDRISPDEINQLKAKLLKERAGKEEIERKLKEIKLDREEKGFVPMEEAKQAITRVLEPIARLFSAIPKKYSLRMNPSDPDHAEQMLREMVEEIKGQIQADRGKKISKRKGVK